jgi:hypothetical protein
MVKVLKDLAHFRGDQLFNGAVNIDWFFSNAEKASDAAKAFVFHGPGYHGVSQSDVGVEHGHKLEDTANFTKSILRRCYGLEDQPFTLAIAGYGTGKSHFGLTISQLLSAPDSSDADAILNSLEKADPPIGNSTRELTTQISQPCLVIALNGMKSFDLASEVSRQIVHQLKQHACNTQALDNLRPRFAQAASLVKMAAGNQEFVDELLQACDVDSFEEILNHLEQQDDQIYRQVYQILDNRNIKIKSLGGESVRDVIEVALREYCGHDKPFRSISILFDEFGKYIEFATVKSHIAGSGVLQDLFEAVQENSSRVSFVGFIQFELNAYMQRVAPEHKNEMLRYITRYQQANKVYLSINLETLIANLIDKQDERLVSGIFDNEQSKNESTAIIRNITKWFPMAKNHRLWTDAEVFHKVIRKGCWPLSPYAVWLLYYLAAAGKHLQERSVLALLNETFSRYSNQQLKESTNFTLTAADLWSDALEQELITSEESGQQGAITHAFNTVQSRHGAQLSPEQNRILKSIVLASKLSLKADRQSDAVQVIAEFSGLSQELAQSHLKMMREELNIIEWDDSFKQFDILGDAVPRTQFLSFLRQRVANTYNEAARVSLFAKKARACSEHLEDIRTDFAERNRITTKEWFFEATVTNLDNLQLQIKSCIDNWEDVVAVNKPRGNVFYCYVEQSQNIEATKREIRQLTKQFLEQAGKSAQPILVVLLHDSEGKLGHSLAELAILDESLSEQDKARFGNLVNAHKEKIRENIRTHIIELLKERRFVTPFKNDPENRRISQAASAVFQKVYKSPLTFPFDGFSTANGNAAMTCQTLTRELLQGRLDWNGVMSKPVKEQNRAVTVLKDTWGIFDKAGTVSTRPKHPVAKKIMQLWDEKLNSDEQCLPLYDAVKEICGPPYGANIASAGLLLGVYIAARIEKVSVVKSDNLMPNMTIKEWLRDDLFKGKFIELQRLQGIMLIPTGEASSEWETLLDEWDQAGSYRAEVEFLIKSNELKKRVPLPPQQAYKAEYLKKGAETALEKLKQNEKAQNFAISRIESGREKGNFGLVIHGASEMAKLLNGMENEQDKWESRELEEIEQRVHDAKTSIIQHFEPWLEQQRPDNGTPEVVGDFRHKMSHKVGNSLSQLALFELKQALQEHTNRVINEVQIYTDARNLVREANHWLDSNTEALNLIRVAELRSLENSCKEYIKKLKNLYRRLEVTHINDAILRLADRREAIKEALKQAQARASTLWETNIHNLDEAEQLQTEVDALFTIYEGCPVDLEDLQVMRRCLRQFIQVYQQLDNEQLTEEQFEELTDTLVTETERAIGEEEQPWDIPETITYFKAIISEQRMHKSQRWMNSLLTGNTEIDALKASDLNALYTQVNNPPPVLTEAHKEELKEIRQQIEQRLKKIRVEWLIEQYKQLSPDMQEAFISRIM